MDTRPTSDLALPFRVWSHLRYRLLWAYDGPVAAGYASAPFRGSTQGAWLLRQGTLRLSFADGIEYVRAPSWVFPRTMPGRQDFSPDAILLSVRIRAVWPNNEHLFALTKSLIVPPDQYPDLERHALPLPHLVKQADGTPSRHLPGNVSLQTHINALSALHQWLSVYIRVLLDHGCTPTAPRNADPRMSAAMNWLADVPFTRPFSEEDLARRVHLSVSQLNRLFVRDFNVTPLAMRDRLRLETAQQYLEERHRSIKTIAYELGFSSPGNFSTWFRKQTGITPRQWQRKMAVLRPDRTESISPTQPTDPTREQSSSPG